MWKFSKQLVFLIGVSLFVTSCGSRSLEEFKEEGKGITRSLIQELQTIHFREQLLASSTRLEHLFNDLVDVMIAAKEFCPTPEEVNELTSFDHDLSDHLRLELNRIYRLEGGRQIIEKCQEKALARLSLLTA